MSSSNALENSTDKKVYDYTQTDLERMAKWGIKFGKHKGKNFGELLTEEPDYCQWIVKQFDETDALVQFITRSLEVNPAELVAGC